MSYGWMRALAAILLAALLAFACGTQKKIDSIRKGEVKPDLTMSGRYESDLPELHVDSLKRDTLQIVDFDGQQKIIMKAVQTTDGGLVATEELQAAVVTARFRNIAERAGQVDIRFDVRVPAAMRDTRWRIRLFPDMYVMDDTLRLDPVIITGEMFREDQLKGYERYQRFLDSIISDTTKFVDLGQLELYLERYFEELYALKTDSTVVSVKKWESIYGVTQQQAIDHYTDRWSVVRNERRKAARDRMYARWVKVPIALEGIRIDTVLADGSTEFVYEYVQTIAARPRLRKVDVVLSGDIYEGATRLYDIPKGDPLTFYISSLSSFADGTERYLTKVVERRVEANSVCWIGFPVGKADVLRDFGDNEKEMARIESNLRQVAGHDLFEIDSVTVTASASPEGSEASNRALALRRAASVSSYFGDFTRRYLDSLRREEGFAVEVSDADDAGTVVVPAVTREPVRFLSRSDGENWDMLTRLVAADSVLTDDEKETYMTALDVRDQDAREARLHALPSYRHLREEVYPFLRTVRFDFHLHRKGMVKDTVHTTVIDSVYMEGVRALKEMDYEGALLRLAPYKDYNAAVAAVALDRNHTALEILERCPRSGQREYLMAIIWSRLGDDQKAVQHYLDAVTLDRSYVFRGNLDPEISVLIKKYGLNEQDDADAY